MLLLFVIAEKVIGTSSLMKFLHYSLGTGESYGPAAQHMQDCPIFFIQLNYVHNNKEIRYCHLMICSPTTRWHWGFHFLFLSSAILHSCNFGHSCNICQYLFQSLTSIIYFCWIVLVCIYRYAFRHILGCFTLLLCT